MLECGMKLIRGEALFVCDKMAYCEMLEITMMGDFIQCVCVSIHCIDSKLIVGLVHYNTVDFNDSIHDISEKQTYNTIVIS